MLLCVGLREKSEILSYQEILFIGESEGYVKKKLWKWATVSTGPRWGTWRRVRLAGTLRDSTRVLGKRSVSVYGSSVR